MIHLIDAATNSNRVAYYNGTKNTLDIYRLPNRITHGLIHPLETHSLRLASSLSNITTHPKLPAVMAIVERAQPTLNLPKGPGSSGFNSTNVSGTGVLNTSASKPKANSAISLNLYTNYNKEIISTPMILEFDSSIEKEKGNGTPIPKLVKYSTCGDYLAVYNQTQNSSVNNHEILIFDVNNNYKYITSTSVDVNIENLEWVCEEESKHLVAGCIDGTLRLFKISKDSASTTLSLEQTLNISSSPIASISYYDSAKIPGLLVGTRDGNTYIIDPVTMICSYSNLTDADLTVLSVYKGPKDLDLVSYVNGGAHIVQMVDGMFKDIKQLTDLHPNGCGVVLTSFGAVLYVSKEGILQMKSVHNTLRLSDHENTEKTTENSTSKPTSSSSSSSNITQTAGAQSKTYGRVASNASRQKRSLDLFDPMDKGGSDDRNNKRKRKDYSRNRDYWGNSNHDNSRSNGSGNNKHGGNNQRGRGQRYSHD